MVFLKSAEMGRYFEFGTLFAMKWDRTHVYLGMLCITSGRKWRAEPYCCRFLAYL